MAWQPAQGSLAQLAACLKDSLSGTDKDARKQADAMLQQAKQSPDVNNYLAYLFSSTSPPDGLKYSDQDFHVIRSAAGIMLKNDVRSDWNNLSESSQQFVKMVVPLGLQDKNSQIRNFAGNIATQVINSGSLLGWPELLPQLLEMASNAQGQVSNEAQEGAASALAKICEDNFRQMNKEVNGTRPLNYILPQLISATNSTLPRVRANALTAINVFTPRPSQAMLNLVDDLLQQLFKLAGDNNTDVRRQVCKAFTQLIETRPDKLQPHIEGLVDYIITQHNSEDEDLACQAAEFWLVVGAHDNLRQSLRPYINKIIPVLLQHMAYTGEDIALLGGLSEDEDEEDKEQDIKPAFAKKNLTRSAHADESGSAEGSKNNSSYQKLSSMDDDLEEGEIEIDDDGDDDGDDESPDERWTIRKCSASALDGFAKAFGGPVFEAIFPYLGQNLRHSEWPQREAAVLALGAVGDGCMSSVVPHLPELVPYLISLLDDSEPLIRLITCWTLGRFASWAAGLSDPAELDRFFVPMVDGLLRKMLDKNKKVQRAGTGAFAHLEEVAGRKLEPFCGHIIQQFVRCFAKYKDVSMYVLYDCVQTLAERLGAFIAQPEYANELMPALIGRYNNVSDMSRELFPMLECLSYISISLGDSFSPYAPAIFARCIGLIHDNLEQRLAAANNPALDEPDRDFLVTSLDVISSIIQSLDAPKPAELIETSPHPFFELLTLCMDDKAEAVRQSAFALLGDCAHNIYPQLQPSVHNIFPLLLKQLDMDSIVDENIDSSFDVVSNVCWAAGEIAMQHDKGLVQWIPELLGRLVEIMSNPGIPMNLAENAAVALGRLGLGNAHLLAPALPTFAEEFLQVMADFGPSEEKATAFTGFARVVALNPKAIEKVVPVLFVAIARYDELELQNPVKTELWGSFQQVLQVYQEIMPSFPQFVGQMDAADQQALKSRFMLQSL